MDTALTPQDIISRDAPDEPVLCFRPHRVEAAARWFIERFPARTFYAVKANPAPHVLDALWRGGVRGFDVASMGEVETVVHRFPRAELAYLHPVKNRSAIARAYREFGVRRFVLDSEAELAKILDATGGASDLTLLLRLGVSNHHAKLKLDGKFGADMAAAEPLMRDTRAAAAEFGVSFHVGSQSLSPVSWHAAMAEVSRLIVSAGVTVDIVDIGGGFPGIYADGAPPELDRYAETVAGAFADMPVLQTATLWCEPGRALVAEGESLLTRIDGIKPGALYLNDGSFGALYDAVHEGWAYPVRALSAHGEIAGENVPWTVFGPTCDSADRLPEPLMLPAALREGDYLEFGNVGAYGRAMASGFNGFGRYRTVKVEDAPWPSLYGAGIEPAVAGTIGERTVSKP